MPGKILGKPQTAHPTSPPAGTWRIYQYTVDGSLYFQDSVDVYKLTNLTATDVGLGNVTNDAQLKRADNDWVGYAADTSPDSSSIVLVELPSTGAKRKVLLSNLLTKSDVGLGSVTNDAQLKRADNDWAGYAADASPDSSSIVLIELPSSGAKRKVLLSNLTSGGGGFPPGYINGCNVTWFSNTQVKISPGSLRDDANADDVTVASTLTVAITASGANGLDTGSEAANTWYYVYVVKGSSGVAGLLSTSATTPTLPSGYADSQRLVGTIRNNGSSNFYKGYQVGVGNWRHVQYDEVNNSGDFEVVSGGSALSWTIVDCSDVIPTTAIMIQSILLGFGFLTGDFARLRPSGFTNDSATYVQAGAEDTVTESFLQNYGEELEYEVTFTSVDAYVSIIGYIEQV